VEVALSAVFALRAGAFTALSNRPEYPARPVARDLYQFRFDRYGGTLGLGITLGSFDTTIGAVYTRATGQFVTLDNVPTSAGGAGGPFAVGASSDTLFLVLSGAVTLEEARDTIRKTLPADVREFAPLDDTAPLPQRSPAVAPAVPQSPPQAPAAAPVLPAPPAPLPPPPAPPSEQLAPPPPVAPPSEGQDPAAQPENQ
jgi:hypothetical protein